MAISLSIISFRRLTPLFLALIAISALISFTASIFLGIYNTAATLIGEREDEVLVVYDRTSKTPQTSIIPLSLYDKLRGLDGVKALSPEAIAISMIGNRVIVVRGMDPELIQEVYRMRLMNGTDKIEGFSALIGDRLARALKVDVGDLITVRSALTNSFLELEIIGVFQSESPLDDEILVPLYVGQWLRGLDEDAVSLIRVEVDPSKLSKEDLISYLHGEKEVRKKESPITKSSIMRLLTIPRARQYATEFAVRSPRESMEAFLENEIKINQVTIWSIVAVAISGSTLLIYLASTLIVRDHAREMIILRSLGMSKTRLILLMLFITVSLSVISSILGYFSGILASEMFFKMKLFMIGPYVVKPSILPETLLIILVAMAVIVVFGVSSELESILRSEHREVLS